MAHTINDSIIDDRDTSVGHDKKKVTRREAVMPSSTPMMPPVMLIKIASQEDIRSPGTNTHPKPDLFGSIPKLTYFVYIDRLLQTKHG